MKRYLMLAAVGAVLCSAKSAIAQQTATDTQRFVVVVPRNVLITAPADILIIHPETDADAVFPPQQWYVRGNVVTGVTTTFEVNQPFINSSDASFRRDARLDIAIASTLGPANWVVNSASDQTNYQSGDNNATTMITSDHVGHAWVDLTVTFRTVAFAEVLAGDYDTFVVGTVTEN